MTNTFENDILMHECLFSDHGCVLAFNGGAAVGNTMDSFKPLDMAMSLQVVSVLSMENTIKRAHVSVTSMCVSDLAIWLVDGPNCMSRCIYLGWSLGAQFAAAAVLLCEAAFGHPRVLVTLDTRKQFPLRVVKNWDRIPNHNAQVQRLFTAVALPKIAVLSGSGH